MKPPALTKRADRTVGSVGGRVSVFSWDPDLLEGVTAEDAEALTSRVWVSAMRLDPGRWQPSVRPPDGLHALLIVDGLMTRHVSVGGRPCVELIGHGDVLEPWLEPLEGMPAQIEWRVELPTTIAALDGHFMRIAACHEPVAGALIDRLTLRSRRLALQVALATVSPLNERVLLGLWRVANRWGKVTAEGVTIPFPLTHRVIAELVGATRPSVSSAVSDLARQGVAKQISGGWVLCGGPPSAESSDGMLRDTHMRSRLGKLTGLSRPASPAVSDGKPASGARSDGSPRDQGNSAGHPG